MNNLRDWLAEALSFNNFENIELLIAAGEGKWSAWLEQEDPLWSCELVSQMMKWNQKTPTVEEVKKWLILQAPWYNQALFGWINDNYKSNRPLCKILLQTYIKHFSSMLSTIPGFALAWFDIAQTNDASEMQAWKSILQHLNIDRLSAELMYATENTLPYLLDEWLERPINPTWVKETVYWLITREHDQHKQLEYILRSLGNDNFVYASMLLKMMYPNAHTLLGNVDFISDKNISVLIAVWNQITGKNAIDAIECPD